MNDITLALQQASRDDPASSSELLALVYQELRALAAARMARESPGQTLQATALVHEAWIQLVGEGDRTWENRAHFFGAAAQAMRRILVDVARRKSRLKRGGDQERIDVGAIEIADTSPSENILLIHEALTKLEQDDPEQARVVLLKFFGGMTNEEVATYLDIGVRTVYRHWVCAQARLARWIQQTPDEDMT